MDSWEELQHEKEMMWEEEGRRDKYLEWKDAIRDSMCDECEGCEEHNENCPYYDAEEETWDYESCFEDRGEF